LSPTEEREERQERRASSEVGGFIPAMVSGDHARALRAIREAPLEALDLMIKLVAKERTEDIRAVLPRAFTEGTEMAEAEHRETMARMRELERLIRPSGDPGFGYL
jgi:hypothetical protein